MTNLEKRVRLTEGRVGKFSCPPGKSQAFLWDSDTPSLALRVTPTGRKTYAFESRLRGKTIRVSIGTESDWSIPQARLKAQELKRMVDSGVDPREHRRKQLADLADKALTVGAVWPRYLSEGKPKRRDGWKPRYRSDLVAMAGAGGENKRRGRGLTRPGPIYPLLALPLVKVTEDALTDWYEKEAARSKHQAARALMMFRGFLRWASARPEYRALIDRQAGKAAAIVENLPAIKRRTDALEAAQVSGWWAGVEQLNNRIASTYLRALLLTGARREELATLTWANVNLRWRKLTISDKVDATRTIPLTPYFAQLLGTIPKLTTADGAKNPYVFASESGRTGRISDVRASHAKALSEAKIEGLTIHGLRRSFSLLGEAAGAPAGAIAQVMGHKPSATAEGYRPRSLDALRPFHEQIEAHILKLAGIKFDPKAEPGTLALVA